MKILEVRALGLPEVKVIRFARFRDARGYFTEAFRKSDFACREELDFLRGLDFVQCNESCSKKGVVRGLHFQWNPYQGKLVRSVLGGMADLVLDIRIGSPAFGRIIAHDMPTSLDDDYAEWIWVPPGFAHGNFFTESSVIEYFCTGEYNPECEAGISPLSPDIDWSLCNVGLKEELDALLAEGPLITEKDRCGFTLGDWVKDERSRNFLYERLS